MSDLYTDVDVIAAAVAADHVSTDIAAPTAAQIRAALDAVAPAIAARAWQEGFDRAEYMARCWGHTDYWGEADPDPTNPDRADEIERGGGS